MIEDPLYLGEQIRLTEVRVEDAKIEAAWLLDPDYSIAAGESDLRPYSPSQLSKRYEEQAKAEQEDNRFDFAIRRRTDDSLLGFARLTRLSWAHGSVLIRFGLGSRLDEQQYGCEAFSLILNYVFEELNLHRASFRIAENRSDLVALAQSLGFIPEIRRRNVIYTRGRLWDELTFGILEEEWRNHKQKKEGQA